MVEHESGVYLKNSIAGNLLALRNADNGQYCSNSKEAQQLAARLWYAT